MLLITRRTGEAIVINGSIEVKVLDVKGGRVKLGFEYPEGSTVFRQELFDKIQTENRAAALAGKTGVASGKANDSDKLSIMVQNLRNQTETHGDKPDGDEQKGRKNEHRNPRNPRSPNGTPER